ncbi:MAG: DUF3047 domain-containing protein [Deltaproteobacteria bacterium]|nr:DUF3047 domain-containing protein [Deltaproteobacteria bacterium]
MNNPVGLLRSLALITPFLAVVFLLLPLLPALADETVKVHIPPGESPPKGWTVKEWRGKADIGVVKTQFGNAIHMKSAGTSSAVYKEISFDLREFPHLNWRWKAVKLPRGADVRKKTTDDQAVQVYVVFPRWPEQVNSRLVGYIWDSSAPEGLAIRSAKSKNTRYIVLKSGGEGLGSWFQEKRNVYDDYRALFNEEPPKAGSVSIMIDSDDTKSTAEAFVSDIYFSK